MAIDSESFDRTNFVLPHDLIFHALHSLALNQNTTAIRDNNSGAVVTHQQLLSDILASRNKLRTILDPETVARLRQEREVCILVLAEGYEFCVVLFAALAIGAIAVPLSMFSFLLITLAQHFCKVTISSICQLSLGQIKSNLSDPRHEDNAARGLALCGNMQSVRSDIRRQSFGLVESISVVSDNRVTFQSLASCTPLFHSNRPASIRHDLFWSSSGPEQTRSDHIYLGLNRSPQGCSNPKVQYVIRFGRCRQEKSN
jgi:hypothetical protein